MNNEKIEIKKDSVIAVYNTARNTNDYGTLHALETLFGIDFPKPKDVKERIKTFKDACRELGESHPLVRQYNAIADVDTNLNAYLKLRIICAALNEGWEPQFTEDEWRWYPWFYKYTQSELDDMSSEEKKELCMIDVSDRNAGYYAGFGYAKSANSPWDTYATVSSRLCLKNCELATYCGKQFIKIWIDFVC